MKLKSALLVIFLFFLGAPIVKAGCTFSTNGSTSIMTSSCSFDSTDDGIDSGSGTSNVSELKISGGTLTILGNQTVAVGKITLTGGSLAIIDGGKVALNRIIYYIDKDNDGYSTSLTPVGGSFGNLTPTPMGAKRKSAFTPTGLDCNDGSALVMRSHPGACYMDHDGDTYTNGAVANATCLSAATCDNSIYSSASTDGAAVTTHTAPEKIREVANADCYDSNANANPTVSAATWFTVNRGDGSFDYNCSGGTEYQYPAIWACNTTGCSSHYFTIAAGYDANPGCGNNGTWRTYAGAGGAACSINIAGAYTSCPAGTTSTVQQGCH